MTFFFIIRSMSDNKKTPSLIVDDENAITAENQEYKKSTIMIVFCMVYIYMYLHVQCQFSKARK